MLSPSQVEQFWSQGYLSGLRVLSEDQAARVLAHLERLEPPDGARIREDPADPLNRLLTSLATHPVVVGVVRSLLGGVGGVRNGDVFIKEPGVKRGGIAWHLDTAVPWPACRGMVNTWLALTPSTLERGCLQVLPGMHHRELVQGPRDPETLTLSEPTVAALDLSAARDLVLAPGCLSVHHFRTPHRSSWNRTPHRRVGVVTRWVGPHTTPEAAESGQLFSVEGPLPPGFAPRRSLRVGWHATQG